MSAALRLEACLRADSERQETAAFILSLRARGVFDTNVLRAMETVPRDGFAPRRFGDLARSDVALPLPCGQTMTAPTVVATMLAALDPRPGHRVLEIGTGTGYVAALLARIGCQVTSTERKEILAASACARIAAAGLAASVQIACGDGLADATEDARYDRILLNGAVGEIRAALTSRLVAGGRLVGAVAGERLPRLVTISRDGMGQLGHALGAPVRLSPLITASAY